LRGHQHERNLGEQSNGGEVLDRIERHRCGVEMRIDREHAGRGDAERVSVGRGLRHLRHADIAAGARPILNHDRLMQFLRNERLQRPNHDVGAAAGRKGDNDLDRLIGIGAGYAGGEQQA
jgi:hypothetical protein